MLVCLITVFAYAGGAWASALYRLLTDGTLLMVWLACATGLGAAVLVVLPLGKDAPPGGLLYLVTSGALGLGLLSLAVLGLGLAGWLNRGTAAAVLALGAICGASLAISWRGRLARVLPEPNAGETPAPPEIGQAIRAWLNAPAGWSWLWLAAMPFLGMAIVVAMMPPGMMWPDEPHWYDVVEYHLQIPREWYEIGRIVPLRHNAFSFFPFNVEMHYLLAMHLRGGPWAGMYLAQFMHLAMVVLTVVATYGFARRLAPNRAGATIAGVAVATVPWLTQLGSIAYNEGGLLLFGTLATGWATLAVVSPARRLGRFPVAGLMAGFACGCKLTAVPEVLLAVGGLATLGISLGRHARCNPEPIPLALRLAGVATFVIAGMLAFAPWLARNQIWARNSVFPEAARLLGTGHFSETQVHRWEVAHSPRPDQRTAAARLKAWASDVWAGWQYGYVLLPLGVASIGIAIVRRRHPAALIVLGGMFVALSVIWLGFTHLQGRFFILGVPLAGMTLGLASWEKLALRLVASAAVLVAAVVGFASLHLTLTGRPHASDFMALIGFEDLSAIAVPQPFADAIGKGGPVVLVGDARAFEYTIPMSRLHYRTVFDVDAKPGESVIDAWAADTPPDAARLVDPNELRRFNATYFGIPELPAELRDATEPTIRPPGPPR